MHATLDKSDVCDAAAGATLEHFDAVSALTTLQVSLAPQAWAHLRGNEWICCPLAAGAVLVQIHRINYLFRRI